MSEEYLERGFKSEEVYFVMRDPERVQREIFDMVAYKLKHKLKDKYGMEVIQEITKPYESFAYDDEDSVKRHHKIFMWSRRASAQPTAGRALAGRPEAASWLRRGNRRTPVGRITERQAGNALSGERSNRGE